MLLSHTALVGKKFIERILRRGRPLSPQFILGLRASGPGVDHVARAEQIGRLFDRAFRTGEILNARRFQMDLEPHRLVKLDCLEEPCAAGKKTLAPTFLEKLLFSARRPRFLLTLHSSLSKEASNSGVPSLEREGGGPLAKKAHLPTRCQGEAGRIFAETLAGARSLSGCTCAPPHRQSSAPWVDS